MNRQKKEPQRSLVRTVHKFLLVLNSAVVRAWHESFGLICTPHTIFSATPHSAASTGRIDRSPLRSVSTCLHRRFADASRLGGTFLSCCRNKCNPCWPVLVLLVGHGTDVYSYASDVATSSREIAVRQVFSATKNIALEAADAKVMASNSYKAPDKTPEYAVDGDMKTFWQSQNRSGEKWFEIRWDVPQTVAAIRFYVNKFFKDTNYHIQVYDDETSTFQHKTTLQIRSDARTGAYGEAVFLHDPFETSRIRLVFPCHRMPRTRKGLRLFELQVFSLHDTRTTGINTHSDSFEVIIGDGSPAAQMNIQVTPGSRYSGAIRLKALSHMPKANYTLFISIYEKEASLLDREDFRIAEVQFRGRETTDSWAPGDIRKVPFELWIPHSAPHGIYELRFEMRGENGSPAIVRNGKVKKEVGVVQLGSATIDRYGSEGPDFSVNYESSICTNHGHATLLINDQAQPAIFYAVDSVDYDTIHQYAQTTTNHLYRVGVGSPLVHKHSKREKWISKFLIGSLEKKVNRVLNVDPHAKFIVVAMVRVTTGWILEHDGDEGESEERVILADRKRVRNHSLHSDEWKEDANWALSRLIKEIEGRPWGTRVIGLHLAGGGGGEFQPWGRKLALVPRKKNQFGDYNPDAIRRFRKWLKAKYKNDVQLLRENWRDQTVDFDSAMYSSDALLAESGNGFFREVRESVDSLDYLTFRSEDLMDTLNSFGATIKESFSKNVIVGGWFGYLSSIMNLSPGSAVVRGFGSFGNLIQSPHFDYFSAPYSYNHRRHGKAFAINGAYSSFNAHNKLFISEFDTRTYQSLSQRLKYDHYSREESNTIALRDIGAALAMGVGWWRVDFSKAGWNGQVSMPWFTDTEHLRRDKFGFDMYRKLLAKPAAQTAEIAVILDYDIPKYMDLYASIPTHNMINRFLGTEMNKVGAPFHIYTLQDLLLPRVRNNYKMYIFLNTYHVHPSILKTIDEFYEKDGKVLVWMWAPGYVQHDQTELSHVEKITGFELKMTKAWNDSDVKIVPDHRFARDLRGSSLSFKLEDWDPTAFRRFYDKRIAPTFWPVLRQPGLDVFGHFAFNREPALAAKDFGTHTSIYCGLPFMPAKLIRNMAREYGLHIYYDSDDAYVYANEKLVVIHTGAKPQVGLLQLPKTNTICNAFTGHVLGKHQEFKVKIPSYATRIYHLK